MEGATLRFRNWAFHDSAEHTLDGSFDCETRTWTVPVVDRYLEDRVLLTSSEFTSEQGQQGALSGASKQTT